MPPLGFKLTTSRSSVQCSAHWAREESVGDFWIELSFVSCTTSHVVLCWFLESIEHDFIKALMIHIYNQIVTTSRSRGAPGTRAPPTPRFGGPSYTIWRPSVQFTMNFRALFYIFSKKFLASLRSASLSHFIFFYSHHFIFHLPMCILLHHITQGHKLSCL